MACPKIVFVPKISGLYCGKHCVDVIEHLGSFYCAMLYFSVSLFTAQILYVYFCIDWFRIWIIDDKSFNAANVPFFCFLFYFKYHCAVWVQIFKINYAKCAWLQLMLLDCFSFCQSRLSCWLVKSGLFQRVILASSDYVVKYEFRGRAAERSCIWTFSRVSKWS